MVLFNNTNQHIAAVMETMGWPEDAFMPIANEENRILMQCIEEQMEAKKMKTEHRDQLTQRVKLIEDHHKNAQIGLAENLVREFLGILRILHTI